MFATLILIAIIYSHMHMKQAVSLGYKWVAAVLLQFLVAVMIFPIINILFINLSTLQSMEPR
jgi:hypothetical protein